MRIVIGLTLVLSALVRAQAPGYLLDDFEAAAARDVPYFALEARLRVAELTRFSEPKLSRKFAEAAARTRAPLCGAACYQAIRLLAGFDLDAAEAAAALHDARVAYPALAEQMIDQGDGARFLALLHQAHLKGLYGAIPTSLAIERLGGDADTMAAMVKVLANDLPVYFKPADANSLFETFRRLGPETIDPELIRPAVAKVRQAILQPEFSSEPFPTWTTFLVHGRKVSTYSLAEAAYFRALAFAAATDGLPNDQTLPAWAPRLNGLKLDELSQVLKEIEFLPRPPPAPQPSNEPPPPDSPEGQLLAWLDFADRGGALTEQQYSDIYAGVGALLPLVDDEFRLHSISRAYTISIKWPAVPERDKFTALYVDEIIRMASIDTAYAHHLRDSGYLLERLDGVLNRIGRVSAEWPDCLKHNRTLLTRHLLYEVEQATLHAAVDATFAITGGSDLTLRDLRGRVVIIAFWRTDCAPCQSTRQAINKLNQPIGKSGIWAIAVSTEPEDQVLATLEEKPFWASISSDRGGRLTRTFGVRNVPAVIVIDRAGFIAARLNNPTPAALFRAVEDAGAHR